MKTLTTVALVAVLAASGATSASAQAGKKEDAAAMKKEAKISLASARRTALALVPGGTVKASELEREKGKLIYSFEIATKGRSGIDEVNVDAITGKVVGGIEHESPRTERKEATMEAKGTRKP